MNTVKTSPMRVTVIVPAHNRLDHTLACLASLQAVTYPQMAVIVVDDGSSDGTAAAVTAKFPQTTVLGGDGSLWWTGAVNKGIQYALTHGCEAVCLVNNDNTFAADFLSRLVACMRESSADAVCARVIDRTNGRIFFAGGIFHPWRGLRMRRTEPGKDTREENEIAWCGGMGLLISADALRSYGAFDERTFPHYYADADFCLRLRKRGGRLVYCPHALVLNDTQSSGVSHRSGRFADLAATLFSRRSHLNLAATWRFYRRHRPLLLPLVLPGRLLRVCGGFVLHRLYRRRR